jgi:putative PIN family toxin of toxin-antitoxin system
VSPAARVVLDTNVVLSALLFGGATATALRQAWQSHRLLPLVSTATTQELIRVLAYPKFRLTLDERQELLADYLPFTSVVCVPSVMVALPDCRDPFDVPFLHLAAAGKAKALVSGDKDLLALSGRFSVPILAPAAFLERFAIR